jgi:hypothetical protein
MGDRTAEVRVTVIVQQSFRVTLCVTYNLNEWHFRLNLIFQLHETDFMKVVSFACGLPNEGNEIKIRSRLTNGQSETCMN